MVGLGGGRGENANDICKATKEWHPWLVMCTENDNSPYPRKCTFCGWNKVFVWKKAFTHFGYSNSSTSKCCPKIPRNVREKFRTCNEVVPKAMCFEKMFEAPFTSVASSAIGKSLLEQIVDVELEGSMNLSGTNETMTLTPNLVDSTLDMVARTRNCPMISHQRSLDESLQVGLRQKLDNMWASFF